MRQVKFLLILLSLLIFVVAWTRIHNIRKTDTPEKGLTSNSLIFMTFNIRAGAGIENPGKSPLRLKSSEKKIEKLALAIKSIDPDVVALQEVKGSEQAKRLAKRLNLNYVYTAHTDPWGLAMLSKHTILKASGKKICKGCKLKRPSGRSVNDPRSALVSVIDINGKQATFINVHYHLGVYEQQVKATMDLFKSISGPVVLMGDLNREQHHSEIKPIQEKLNDTCLAVDVERCEYINKIGTKQSGTNAGLRIDYIFVDPESFEVEDVGVAEENRDASDHLAYFAKVVQKSKH